ncbi:tRNA (guanine-N(1)-)-methyltransferase [Achlya hypogyna]|uniref:tRNA (guanine(9)-N(1))-methyltransferase n=1 Tax=Achlya hypogyna TaxID=1202772 RepID=A0A1V9YHF7_ACHHY|nr:tRNA (guanine-N(1)-)-methyltransferase [Achlya hypogyna]
MEETYEEKLERKTAELKQRKKDRRRELLCSMSAGKLRFYVFSKPQASIVERRVFLLEEAAAAAARKERLENALSQGQRIAFDCGYDEIMSEKEINSLSKQIKFSYGTTKRMTSPFALTIANYHGRIEAALQRFGIDQWKVCTETRRVHEIFNPEELVFLTPDSPNVLETLDPTKVYVIGGIVDRSRVKGRSRAAADAIGVATARLPIQEYILDRHNDHILNVNTVVDILAAISGGADWPSALASCLPKQH